jgi:hypothetical protein
MLGDAPDADPDPDPDPDPPPTGVAAGSVPEEDGAIPSEC